MRIAINLATRPFVELRPLFARLRLAMAALAVTAIALGISLHLLNARARADQAQMDELKAQTLTVQIERQTNEARMHEPRNRAVLERSIFLNDLFARKSFSWTSVMMDLERVLPAGVQVTSIDPAITAEGNVNIRLRVSGQRDLAVDLVRNLERSQRFLAPRLTNETAQSQERGLTPVAETGVPGGVEFEILSGYNPLPASSKDHEPEQKDTGAARNNAANQNRPATPSEHKAAVHQATDKSAASQKSANNSAAAGHKTAPAHPAPPAAASKAASKPSADGGAL
jgi:type IV pilus assembly protein PilN